MLVLSRKLDQEIVIDGNITVRVLKVKGNVVKLGLIAPAEVSITRGELPSKEREFGSDFSRVPTVPPNEGPVADFTVVFADEEEPAEVPSTNRCFSDAETIRFRSALPTALHHNRLQEIVNRVSNAQQS